MTSRAPSQLIQPSNTRPGTALLACDSSQARIGKPTSWFSKTVSQFLTNAHSQTSPIHLSCLLSQWLESQPTTLPADKSVATTFVEIPCSVLRRDDDAADWAHSWPWASSEACSVESTMLHRAPRSLRPLRHPQLTPPAPMRPISSSASWPRNDAKVRWLTQTQEVYGGAREEAVNHSTATRWRGPVGSWNVHVN